MASREHELILYDQLLHVMNVFPSADVNVIELCVKPPAHAENNTTQESADLTCSSHKLDEDHKIEFMGRTHSLKRGHREHCQVNERSTILATNLREMWGFK